jgi:hypothetical protein
MRHDGEPAVWEIRTCWHNEAELARKALARIAAKVTL